MVNSYDVAVLSEKVAYLEAVLKSAGIELPTVTSADNGKTLQVVNGAWATGDKMPEDELPAVTSDDNGKALIVSDGAWGVGNLLKVKTNTVEVSFGANGRAALHSNLYTPDYNKIINMYVNNTEANYYVLFVSYATGRYAQLMNADTNAIVTNTTLNVTFCYLDY